MKLMDTLNRAFAAHRSGQFAEAERLYKAVLNAQPGNFQALHMMGLVAVQEGRFDEASKWLDRALSIDPRSTGAHADLGNVLRNLGREKEALASFERALALDPDHPAALNGRASILHALGRNDEALETIDRALARASQNAIFLNNRGIILNDLQRYDEALLAFDRALAVYPNYVDALFNRGNALAELQNHDEALTSYDRALSLDPHHVEAFFNRGVTLAELNRHEEALKSYDQALALAPDHGSAWRNRGDSLIALGRYNDALDSLDRALALKPHSADAFTNRGTVLAELQRHDEALDHFARAIAITPDHPEARLNESLSRLAIADFARGWPAYEGRWATALFKGQQREFRQPLWRGDAPLAGKRILLHAEQGLGDTIQFCRYAKAVAAEGATVLLEVQPALVSWLAGLPGIEAVVARGAALPSFDFHCPLLTLPLAFKTTIDTIPAEIPYLSADPNRMALWQEQLGRKIQPRIGLAWSGSAVHKNDRNRSIPLSAFADLVSRGNVQFISLQKEVRGTDKAELAAHSEILTFDALTDFADTAALVATLDLIITVDTSVAHVAGAMGKAVWILLPFNADWRWLIDRENSPWYPTARLFRQSAFGNWGDVLRRVGFEIAQLCGRPVPVTLPSYP